MILIISQNGLEESTNSVIDWLNYYKADYFRINGNDLDINSNLAIEISNDDNSKFSSLPFPVEEIKAVWYRRWGGYHLENLIELKKSLSTESYINAFLKNEYKHLSHTIFSLFNEAYWLSDPPKYRIEDKMLYLKLGKKYGLTIPNTYIFTKKNDLIRTLKKTNKGLITKAINNARTIKINEKSYMPYTSEVLIEDMPLISESFFPSLFQEKIEKDYEIRTFFLDGKFYSMAIFSQNDTQTSIDFRRYNFEKPNRNVPYSLPKQIEKKLLNILNDLKYNTASIDLIKSKDGIYYFLEINPVGQYGMTSIPCNYNLDKLIAEHLIEKNNEKRA